MISATTIGFSSTLSPCKRRPSALRTALRPPTLLANVDDFVFGDALRRSARDPEIDLELGTKLLATGELPRLAEAFGGSRVETSKDRFERGLRAILDSAL